MKRLALIAPLALLYSTVALGEVPVLETTEVAAETEKEVLACIHGIEAGIAATHTTNVRNSDMKFLLTLMKQNGVITSVQQKTSGMPEAFLETASCTRNQKGNMYSCTSFSQ